MKPVLRRSTSFAVQQRPRPSHLPFTSLLTISRLCLTGLLILHLILPLTQARCRSIVSLKLPFHTVAASTAKVSDNDSDFYWCGVIFFFADILQLQITHQQPMDTDSHLMDTPTTLHQCTDLLRYTNPDRWVGLREYLFLDLLAQGSKACLQETSLETALAAHSGYTIQKIRLVSGLSCRTLVCAQKDRSGMLWMNEAINITTYTN